MTGLTRRAAQYIRMSTAHQRDSPAYQRAANAEYAEAHGLEIVRTYLDSGISGLTIAGRTGLASLLADVLRGDQGFQTVLVYDISRWGRFQDPDQSAHYEFLCREAGVEVAYTGENFQNDGSVTATLIKSVKRIMAAEYSRDLSAKVRRSKALLGAQGYWMGGPPGYGLRRRMIDPDGGLGQQLEAGQRKALQGHHCVLVLGPPAEVETVRRIFRMFVVEGLRTWAIADLLNAEGIAAEDGTSWSSRRVRRLLVNEKYSGTMVGGQVSSLFKRRSAVPCSRWVRVENALPAIVSREMSHAARAHLLHKPKVSDEEMLQELRDLLAREGKLTQRLIREDLTTRTSGSYQKRLGRMMEIYERLGYVPAPNQRGPAKQDAWYRPYLWRLPRTPFKTEAQLVSDLRRLLADRGGLTIVLIDDAPYCSSSKIYRDGLGGMRRAYALAGYEPSRFQEANMRRRGQQSITVQQARVLREQALMQGEAAS